MCKEHRGAPPGRNFSHLADLLEGNLCGTLLCLADRGHKDNKHLNQWRNNIGILVATSTSQPI